MDIFNPAQVLAFFAETGEKEAPTVIDPSSEYYNRKVSIRCSEGHYCMVHPEGDPDPKGWRWIERKALVVKH